MSLTEHLTTLISHPTVTGDRAAADALIAHIRPILERHLTVEVDQINNVPFVLAYGNSAQEPRLLLTAHLDVVPASKEQFTATIDGDRLVGRGAFDMKHGAACYLQLLDEIGDDLRDKDVAVLFTFDEEIGGYNGMKALVDRGLRPTVAVLPDGGDNFGLEKMGKGCWQGKLSKTGKPSHGSRPWEGKSPVREFLQCLLGIEEAFATQALDTDTCVITTIGGGDASNRTPKDVYATLDLRFMSQDTLRQSVGAIETLCKQYGVTLEVNENEDAFETGVDTEYLELFQSIYLEKMGKKMEHQIVCGSADTRFLSAAGVPTIMTRPAGGGAHGDDEWISIKGLTDFYDILKEFVIQCLR